MSEKTATVVDTPEMLATAARNGASLGVDCGKMCGDCAFRVGSDANNDGVATEAALQCLMSEGQFNCHTSDFQNAGKPCAGFLYAQQWFKSPEFYKTLKIPRNVKA